METRSQRENMVIIKTLGSNYFVRLISVLRNSKNQELHISCKCNTSKQLHFKTYNITFKNMNGCLLLFQSLVIIFFYSAYFKCI